MCFIAAPPFLHLRYRSASNNGQYGEGPKASDQKWFSFTAYVINVEYYTKND